MSENLSTMDVSDQEVSDQEVSDQDVSDQDVSDQDVQAHTDAKTVENIVSSLKTEKVEVLSSLSAYDGVKNDGFRHTLKKEVALQLNINDLLKSDRVKENVTELQRFVDDNSQIIDSQLEQMTKLFKKLTELVRENKVLTHEKIEMLEFCDNNQKLSDQIKEIETLKKNVVTFLDVHGITSVLTI
jgi:hypothetical protein